MEDNQPCVNYREALRQQKRRNLRKLYLKIAASGILIYVTFALFFPIYACGCNGMGNGHRVSCQSNMKQLSLALSQYTQDNDGNLPPITQPSAKATWREAIYPFVKSTGVYRCPDDSSDQSLNTTSHLPQSYGANSIDWNKHAAASPFITLVDMDGYHGAEWNIGSPTFLPASGRELHIHKDIHAFYEHPSGLVNCLFTDGHVKALKPMSTLAPVNLWTRDNAPFTGQELSNAQAILRHAETE